MGKNMTFVRRRKKQICFVRVQWGLGREAVKTRALKVYETNSPFNENFLVL